MSKRKKKNKKLFDDVVIELTDGSKHVVKFPTNEAIYQYKKDTKILRDLFNPDLNGENDE
jgi:hypothetical protein